MPTTRSKPVYTEADRARLLAPISIRSYGGKSWGGVAPNSLNTPTRNHRYTGDSAGDRYVNWADRSDVDHM